MKKIAVAWVPLCLVATTAAATELESRVAQAVIYSDGALVTRQARLQLPAGEHTVELINLPPVVSNDVRIAAADNRVRLGQILTRSVPTSSSYDADYAAAEAALREQQLVIQAINDADEAAKLQLSFLQSFAEGYAKDARLAAERSPGNSTNWRAALALLDDGTSVARATLRENVTRRFEAEAEFSRRQQILNQLRGSARRRSVLSVTLASPATIDTTLSISYFDENAHWSPLYEARLDSQTKQLELLQIAEVGQDSDEDWVGVELTLSTSQPTEELEAPELESERLQLMAEQSAPRKRALASAAVADAVEEIIVTGSRVAAPNVGSYAVDYTIPGRVNLANNTDETTFDLVVYRFDAELVTTVVPLESTDAFLQARFTYNESLPLIGSRMLIYVDGTFAGWSSLRTALPGAEVTIPMGRDRRVELQVRPQAAENDRRGVINRRRYETTHTLYEIVNRRATPTLIEVWDRYPVAEDRDIRVDVDDSATTPTATDVDDEPGIIKFERQLSGGESWTIRQRYTVSYPQKQRLVRR
ncbi:MAG: mucoidy inhibitor MuiA family protein [Pseudomonadota bacterium]